MLVAVSFQPPPMIQIAIKPGDEGIPFGAIGTDRELGSKVFLKNGKPVTRRVIQYWRQGKKRIPEWAQRQLSNIYWRKVILNNMLLQYGQNGPPPSPEIFPYLIPGMEGMLMNPMYWKRVRRDGRPIYTPNNATVPAAAQLALSNFPQRILSMQPKTN